MSKLVVVAGPTGSGKSALGLELAQEFNGEIINADSKAIYRFMDIGTAKPADDELLLVPHHLVNIKNPNELYSAAEFKRDALRSIALIDGHGRLPIMVGGTGLYVDSVVFNYQFPATSNPKIRAELNQLNREELLERLMRIDPETFISIDLNNTRRVVRAIELAGQAPSREKAMRSDTLVIGLVLSKESIQKRLEYRLNKMLEQGLIDEVRKVGQQFGWTSEAMSALAYRVFKDYIQGEKTLEEASKIFTKQELDLTKRQMTWFKRNQGIKWLDAEDANHLNIEAKELVRAFLLGYN